MRRFVSFILLSTLTLASYGASAMSHTASSTSCLPGVLGQQPQQIVNEATRRARAIAMESARGTLELKCAERWNDLEIVSHTSKCNDAVFEGKLVCVTCTATATGKC